MPEHRPGNIDRQHVFSPCYDENGEQYHLVVAIGRIGALKHSPLRVHGTGASVDLARADALRNFDHATTSLRQNPPSSAR